MSNLWERWCRLDSGSGKKKKAAQKKSADKTKAWLLGLGLDNKDGHVRITRGPNFQLLGGSSDTHEMMTETAVKVNEELTRRGKRLQDISPNEFKDILDRIH